MIFLAATLVLTALAAAEQALKPLCTAANADRFNGKYECFAGGRYMFMDMYIAGATTYQAAGVSGTFHVEPSRKIVLETGSLAKYHAKLLAAPRIGLNTDGGSFYATTCELKKK